MNDTALILNDVETFIRRYVVLGRHELTACTLWAAHTHVMDAAFSTPYLAITSAVPSSGKTRLLEVLKRLVKNPWLTGSVTTAALVREIDKNAPTLLYDETDNTFKKDKEFVAALHGLLNNGYRRGVPASISVKSGGDWEVRTFRVFCPKALAGLGGLPDTIVSRSITIDLKRRAPGESVEKFRERHADEAAEPVYLNLVNWGSFHVDRLTVANPRLPSGLSDRQEDVWEPLLAIAELAGEEWATRAREAAVALSGASAMHDDALGIRLLEDIAPIIEDTDEIPSAELVEALADLPESPWSEISRGKPMTQKKLAELLRPFDIHPHSNGAKRVYATAAFADAFRRYLPQTVKVSEPQEPCGVEPPFDPSGDPPTDTSRNGANPHEHTGLDTLTLQPGGNGARRLSASEEAVLRDKVARARLKQSDLGRREREATLFAVDEEEIERLARLAEEARP